MAGETTRRDRLGRVPVRIRTAARGEGSDLAYRGSPTAAFALASPIGIGETAYVLVFGREFEAYA